MVIAKRTVSTAYYLIALAAFALTNSLVMLKESNNGGELHAYGIAATFVLWSATVLPVLRRGYKIERPPTTIVLFNIYFLWATFVTAVLPQPGIKTNTYVVNIMLMLLPMVVTDVVYYFTLRHGKTKSFLMMGLAMALLLLYTYYSYYDTDNILLNIHLGTAYYPLFMLPLILCLPHKTVKVVLVVLISLAVFSSVKRGGVLALLAALLVYVVIEQMVLTRRSAMVKIVFGVGVLAVLTILFAILATLNDNNILERFESVGDDGGSGRTLVWWEVWRLITSQDALGMLVGNGFDMVKVNSRLALSAHNDYLEAWYDFGFIGVVLYTLSILSLFVTNLSALLRKHPCASAFSAMSAMVFILSLISHIGIYFWLSIVMMTNAFFIGWIDHDRRTAA